MPFLERSILNVFAYQNNGSLLLANLKNVSFRQIRGSRFVVGLGITLNSFEKLLP